MTDRQTTKFPTLAPITFVHPLRVKKLRLLNVVAAIIWVLTSVLLVPMHPNLPLPIVVVWWISGGWIIVVSAVRTIQGKLDS